MSLREWWGSLFGKEEEEDGDFIKVLLVDDDRSLLELFSHSFKRSYLKARLCSKPEEALKRFQKYPKRYKAVITDYRMPHMDGVEFAQRIRKIRPNVPIAFITACSEEEVRDHAKGLENIVILRKPIKVREELERVVRKLVFEKSSMARHEL